MLKSMKSVLIACLVAVFGAFIVLEALGVRGDGTTVGGVADAETGTAQQADGMPDANDEQKSETLSFIAEPKSSEVVTVLVGLKGAPLLETANERGITIRELGEEFDGEKLLADLQAEISGAIDGLSPYLLETGYRYTGVFNGFSAQVRYGDIGAIEESDLVDCVILSNTYESPKAITENTVDVQDTGIFNSEGVGYDGTGTVVAVLDTGTDYTHEVFDMELDPDTMALSKDDVARAIPYLAATTMSEAIGAAEFDEDELYLTSKLPYAFDYADIDTNVYPEEAHGTHVAGIIAGESQRIRGVAPRAQIATFKVFQDTGNSTSEGILAAVNDAVVLGVDAINMSLGATCGFAREEDEPHVNEVYDLVEESGISLVVAAGNEYSSSYGGAHGNTNLASNPDTGTVGSPASYYASFAVASVSGVKTPYVYANGEKEIYYNESRTTGKTKPNNFVNELLGDKESGEFDYVVIPGVGYEANYTGIDVKGKIAVVKRGSNSFEDKVKIARSKGAVGVIIYNNLSGMLNMTIGTVNLIPSCLINMDLGKYLESKPQGTIRVQKDYLAGPFMSDFSSWGPLPNLELTPDITGHGGDITSSYPGGNEYDTISGTSMACPNIAGALVLVREYVKSMENVHTTTEVRDLSYNLMMSTAAIVRNEEGNPYSPRKQGAGIGDIRRSVTTKAYLSVEGSNKAKISLKDDPTRSGVYELKFNITNLSDEALSYRINPIVMTESMSSDEKTVAEKAYMLSPACTYAVQPKTGEAAITGETISIGGYAEAQLTVTVRLSDADKAYLNEHFINGMYVEGYVELQSYNADKINLNIPYLAFYGNWEDAPMLDVTAYEVGESAVDSSVLAEDKLVADVYGTLPMAGFVTQDDYGNDQTGSWGLGAFGYNVAQGYELPVTREQYASLSHNPDCNYMLYAIGAGLLRNAKRVDMEIRDSVTGELIWSHTDYNARKSHSNGGEQAGGSVLVDFDVRDYDLANNGKYTFNMVCYLDWQVDGETGYTRGNRNTFSFDFYIDDEKPQLVSTYVKDEDHRKTVEFNVYDNHYLQGFIIYTYEGMDENGQPVGLTSISNGVIPVYNGEFSNTTRISYDVTSYWSLIEKNQKNGGGLYVQFMDYAKNVQVEYVTLEECDDIRLDTTRNARDEYTIRPNGQLDLKDYIRIYANVNGEYFENYWVKDLTWTSDHPEIVEVDDGLITGMQAGDAKITVGPGEGATGEPLTFTIHVAGEPTSISVREVELSDYSVRLERGQEYTITATVKPSNYPGDYHLTWASSSANVTVTPVEDDPMSATVKALRSGSASINVRVDGTFINATCSVRVQEEYYVDTVYLRSYTGRGDENGVVDIPDDLGIAYIYPMAFFNNPYIKKIIIPEGVQYIMRAGIYGCDNLEEIVLPESCIDLQTFSVAWNPKLKKINTEHIQTVGSRAFIYDTALEEVDLSRATYISDMAFTNCTSLKKVDLSKVGVVGEQAFQGCTGLTELVIPSNTATMTAAFYQCTNLRRVTIYGGQIGLMTFQGCTALTDVTFAGDVEVIGGQAFYGCTALKNVNFLGTVYEIGSLAFANNVSLTSFKLPAGLSKLGQHVFANDSRLRSITVDKDACIPETELAAFVGLMSLTEFKVEEGNKYLSSENGVLYDKTMYRLIAYPFAKSATTFTVPSSVRVIGANAFTAVENIGTVSLGSVERVEENAFRECTAQISGGDRLSYIGSYAFAGYAGSGSNTSGLRTFPISAATYIGDYAFADCTSIVQTTLTIPDGVTYLGEGAFANCPIRTLNLGNGTYSVGADAFSACTQLTSIDFGALEEIAPGMFSACTSLTSVNIPNTVKTIGEGAFQGDTRLSSVTLPRGLVLIPAYAFYGTAISTIQVPDSVVAVGESAFRGTRLTYFDFNKIQSVGAHAFEETSLQGVQSGSLLSIGERAFSGSKVASATIPAVKTIGEYAFAYCDDLTNVDISAAAEIGAHAFDDCAELTTVKAANAASLGAYAFRGAASLASLNLPALRTVGEAAFEGTSITSLNLPALRTVAIRAFSGAEKLQSITVPTSNAYFKTEDGVLYKKNSGNFFTLVAYPFAKEGTSYTAIKRTVKVGAYAFEGNQTLTSVTLPEHLKSIGAGAFYGSKVTKIESKAVAAPTLESSSVYENGDLINTYNNFNEELGTPFTLEWIAPANATGYNAHIWTTYLGNKVAFTGERQINASALDFIDRVKALPTLSGEARTAEIALLTRIYNVLNAEQRNFIRGDYDGEDYYAKLQQASGISYTENVAATSAAGEETAETAGGPLWIVCLCLVLAGCGAMAVAVKNTQKRRK